MFRRFSALVVVLAAVVAAGLSHGASPALAATCADYPNQAAAQAAGDTRDADGDGIYCESVPCPCSTAPPTRGPVPTSTPTPDPTPTPAPVPSSSAPAATTKPASNVSATNPANCSTPSAVQSITFSMTKYPNIRKHFLRALREGWPRTLVLNRDGAAERRARLLEGVATKPGYDRDEYPPALARGKGAGLTKGIDPRGWRADVALVPSHENRSHGSTMGLKLRRFCNGMKFRYVFY